MTEETKAVRLRDADPKGRVDVAVYRGAEKLAKHVGIEHVWNGGLGELIETVIENTVSSKPITPQDVARELGFGGRKR
jgi:hypothetical protein